MSVVSIVSRKGGSGKTTVALHVAVAGQSAGKLPASLIQIHKHLRQFGELGAILSLQRR